MPAGYNENTAGCMVSLYTKNFLARRIFANTDKAGFTLVEVLVAIAFITIIGFLPISIVSEHLIKNALTKNRVTAGLLAQEIVEYVRYTRDSDILDINGGDWFGSLYDPKSTNEYSNCVIHADDWITGNRANYCTVKCFDGTNKNVSGGECGTVSGKKIFNGFVAGIATSGGIRGKNTDTCDGGPAKANNAFTTTLNIIIAQEDNEVRYATAIPCVSWSNKSGTIKKVEAKETIFEWIQRKE